MTQITKDEIYVVQHNSINNDYKVLYAGRSAKAAIHKAATVKSVKVFIFTPTTGGTANDTD